MKEYSDEMLINKYIDNELNEQEETEFYNRLENNPDFEAMLKDYLETDTLLNKLSFSVREQERKEFMKEYEAFLEENVLAYEPVEEELNFKLTISEITKAINAIPPAVKQWLRDQHKIPNLIWQELTEDIQRSIALFFINPQTIPVRFNIVDPAACRGAEDWKISPKEAFVIDLNKIFRVCIHITEKEDEYLGNYNIEIFDYRLKSINNKKCPVDIKQIDKSNNTIVFEIELEGLKPGVYYWTIKKEEITIVEKRHFFIIKN